MPCAESGSKARAASPQASQPSPHTGRSMRELAGRARQDSGMAVSPTTCFTQWDADNSRAQRSGSSRPSSRPRSTSVMHATTRRPPGRSAVYHQPSAKDSMSVLGSEPLAAAT
jgi:hypothetical protein